MSKLMVQGHPRSKVMVPVDSPWMTSYSTSIVPNIVGLSVPNIVSVTVFEIFRVNFNGQNSTVWKQMLANSKA